MILSEPSPKSIRCELGSGKFFTTPRQRRSATFELDLALDKALQATVYSRDFVFYACTAANKFDFAACQFNALVGHATQVECPALKSATGALPAVMEIPNFAATLKAGEFRAVDVARDQVEI